MNKNFILTAFALALMNIILIGNSMHSPDYTNLKSNKITGYVIASCGNNICEEQETTENCPGDCLAAEICKPFVTYVQGVTVSADPKFTSPKLSESDEKFSELSNHFDIIELGVLDWWKSYDEIQSYIDKAHEKGLKVMLFTHRYPYAYWPRDFPSKYRAYTLHPNGSFIPTAYGTDKANPEAVNYTSAKFKEALSKLRGVDYLEFNEDLLQGFKNTSYYKPDPYYESPTYSDAALQYFRDYLVEKFGDAYADAKFPVDEKVNITPENNYKLFYTNDAEYWNKWYEWRYITFANWMHQMSKSAHEANTDNLNWKGVVYLQWYLWMEKFSDIRGLDFELIASSPYINWLVCEPGKTRNLTLIESACNKFSGIGKKTKTNYGGFIQAWDYNPNFTTPTTPLWLVKGQFDMAIKYNASMIGVYDAGTFVPNYYGNETKDHYNSSTLRLWDGLIAKCVICGNNKCETGETQQNCPSDCQILAVCGNNIKEGTEVCDGIDLAGKNCSIFGFTRGTLTCKADCSFSTTYCITTNTTTCTPNWICTEWSACKYYNIKTRQCTDTNNCGTDYLKPEEEEHCIYGLTSETEGKLPLAETCYDSIKNQNEIGVDCGGICRPCETTAEQETPFTVEQPNQIEVKEKEISEEEVTIKEMLLEGVVDYMWFFIICGTIIATSIMYAIFEKEKSRKARLSAMQSTKMPEPYLMQLKDYIVRLIGDGYTKEQIKDILITEGWNKKIVNNLLKQIKE